MPGSVRPLTMHTVQRFAAAGPRLMLLRAFPTLGFLRTNFRFVSICLTIETLLYLTLREEPFGCMVSFPQIDSIQNATVRLVGILHVNHYGVCRRIWVPSFPSQWSHPFHLDRILRFDACLDFFRGLYLRVDVLL